MTEIGELEEPLRNIIKSDGSRSTPSHHFHPSQISGCSLRVHLDRMTRHETTLSSWLFQGTAVHYYLEEAGILDQALQEVGFHPAFIEYEKNIKYPITEDIWINGTCDILVHDGDEKMIYDIKYSSISLESNHPRLYKYYSQANAYAHMFGADSYGLIMINSMSNNMIRDIHVLEGTMSEENWDIVKSKAKNIHSTLESTGYFEDDVWTEDFLEDKDVGFWKEIVSEFDMNQVPSHDKECEHCPHANYCPVETGMFGGINQVIEKNKK